MVDRLPVERHEHRLWKSLDPRSASAGPDAITTLSGGLGKRSDLMLSPWRHCEEVGRAPIPVTALYLSRADEAELEEYRRLSVDRAVLPLPLGGRDRVLPRIERYAQLVERYG